MPKIAIISEHDKIWALPAWEKAIHHLQQNGMEVSGIWTCPARLGGLRGFRITQWYFTHFGALDFVRLGLFSLYSQFLRLLRGCRGSAVRDFASLAKHYGIEHHVCHNPNDQVVVEWMKSVQADILVIWVGYIIKQQILEAPRVGCINKHASLLPSYKGVFPYLWAYIDNAPQGISFHIVTEAVDGGDVLLQQIVPEPIVKSSMVAFYLYVYQHFSQMLLEAIHNLISGNFAPRREVPPSGFGMPDLEDIDRFRKAGGKIIRWQDIFKAL